MSHELVICLIAIAANLAGMLVVYTAMSHALAQLVWQRRGLFLAIALIVISQLFWIAPALWTASTRFDGNIAAVPLWFGNWLVAGFSIVLLRRTVARIPVALHDSTRLDGLGIFSGWRHTVFPFVRRDLAILAILTAMATLLPFWASLSLPHSTTFAIYEQPSDAARQLVEMSRLSLVGTLPLIAIFFLAKRER